MEPRGVVRLHRRLGLVLVDIEVTGVRVCRLREKF